jgi:Na+/H+-translocating membrane pyrophosphatase
MNNKKLGRDMMYFAEYCKVLAPEQFGSRKNHQLVIAALNKRVTMDVLRQCRQAGGLCSNNAKSCYDHIVHIIAALSMRRMLGVPLAPLACMFLTLQNASHANSTAFVKSISFQSPAIQKIGRPNHS